MKKTLLIVGFALLFIAINKIYANQIGKEVIVKYEKVNKVEENTKSFNSSNEIVHKNNKDVIVIKNEGKDTNLNVVFVEVRDNALDWIKEMVTSLIDIRAYYMMFYQNNELVAPKGKIDISLPNILDNEKYLILNSKGKQIDEISNDSKIYVVIGKEKSVNEGVKASATDKEESEKISNNITMNNIIIIITVVLIFVVILVLKVRRRNNNG